MVLAREASAEAGQETTQHGTPSASHWVATAAGRPSSTRGNVMCSMAQSSGECCTVQLLLQRRTEWGSSSSHRSITTDGGFICCRSLLVSACVQCGSGVLPTVTMTTSPAAKMLLRGCTLQPDEDNEKDTEGEEREGKRIVPMGSAAATVTSAAEWEQSMISILDACWGRRSGAVMNTSCSPWPSSLNSASASMSTSWLSVSSARESRSCSADIHDKSTIVTTSHLAQLRPKKLLLANACA